MHHPRRSSSWFFSAILAAAALWSAASLAQPSIADRISTPPNDGDVTVLPGNTHPDARAAYDRGAVAAAFPMRKMLMVLKRSAAQEAALQKLMSEQTDPASENFHKWLTPDEMGAQYGVSANDLQTITGWLRSRGFSIDEVTKSRVLIQFSGTAGQVAQAFHTRIHTYEIHGENYYGNASDPSIPTALVPVVKGIAILNDFPTGPRVRSIATTRPKGAPLAGTQLGSAGLGSTQQGEQPFYNVPSNPYTLIEAIVPYDFAIIYNVLPLWNAGITGAGQTIAIAGDSDISPADVQTFRTLADLPAKDPSTYPQIIHNGTDPGYNGARAENSLDVEWSGAVAEDANVILVVSADTANALNVENGEIFSAIYIIDNNLAPVMSVSYGYCELRLGSTGNALFAGLWQQAAAQGMSVFVASGDSGSAMCDEHDQSPPDVASDGLQVNGIASTPYNTAVGGTDFNWFNLLATKTYWGANNPTNHSSALGYIPEIPWNESCETPSVVAAYELATLDESPLLSCEYAYASGEDENLVTVGGGGGGVSACTEPTGTTPADCAGGYAKPSWQAGVGVPDDKKRDVPDVALFSAFTTLGNAYLICDSESVPCDYGNIDDLVAQAIGGTSAASPAMAGIMALVVQKMGERQGNANPSLYALAAKDDRANCNSAKVAAGNACNFYDITTDNNAQPCYVPPPPLAISPNCTAPPGPPSGYTETNYLVGVLTGYASGTGYDLATGLGSINAYNLVNNWHTVASAQPYIYLNPATLTFAATLEGTAAADQTVTLENLGKAALSISSVTLGGADASSFSIAKNGCTKALAASASCTLTVGFKPKAAGALTASVLIDDNVTNDSPSSIALTGTGAVTTVTLAPSLAFGSVAVGSTSAAKTVTLENTGKDKLSISSIALGGADPSSFAIASKTCGSALDAGASCNISVEFKPKSAKALTGTLTVTDNALASPQSVTLSGTGTGT